MFGHDDGQQQTTNEWQQPSDQSQVVAPVATDEPTTPVSDFGATAPAVSDPADSATSSTPPVAAIDEHTTSATPSSPPQDLIDIKQQALQQLSPLVGHLEQGPEDKFKTTMMMIQASDDQSLIPDAYAAAQAIGDEKAKAQALLDIVNEINYFTQKG